MAEKEGKENRFHRLVQFSAIEESQCASLAPKEAGAAVDMAQWIETLSQIPEAKSPLDASCFQAHSSSRSGDSTHSATPKAASCLPI